MTGLPNALDRIDEWRVARRRAGRMLFAVDFDGTLAPIVDDPDAATPLPAAKDALRRLAARPDSDAAIVSGRALEDVRPRLGLENLYYAGNHGMEIEGPEIERRHPEAVAARPRLAACAEAVRRALADVDGASVEDKGLTLSVHYRRVDDPDVAATVPGRVRAGCADVPGLRITEGKKVVEIRPDVPWDKGRATRFLLEALEAGGETLVPAVFIGDDRTDEDAFRVVREWGGGIIVGPGRPDGTAAVAWLESPERVATFLAALADEG